MATSVTKVFTVDDTPIGPDGKPLRRSQRNKMPSREDVFLVEEQQTIDGIDYERRSLFDEKKQKTFKLYAVRAMNVDLDNLWPGRIVKAIDCYPQTNLNVEPYDGLTGKTRVAGPIEAKFRYMIVSWATDFGVTAVPLYTMKEARVRDSRKEEFVSVSTDSAWRGETPWAGMPIMARFNQGYACEPRCYADLSRLHWIGQHEAIADDVGRITGVEYSRLMDLVHIKEREYRMAAFARFNTKDPDGNSEVWSPWTPSEPHQPFRGKRYEDDKTRRMDKKKFPSRVSKA
jgi:hypothetical protein